MIKVIIIEDRPTRQEIFLEKTGVKLSNFDCLDNYTGDHVDIIKDSFSKNDFSICDSYNVIALHKSAFKAITIDKLKEYIKEKGKRLILFSGGISSSVYTKEPFEYLYIKSEKFYSKNLDLFLSVIQQEKEIKFLLLMFGEEWKLNVILNVLENINNLSNIDFDDFDALNEETDIENIRDIVSLEKFEGREPIEVNDILEIKEYLTASIDKELGILYE